jgi:hypothetical protein
MSENAMLGGRCLNLTAGKFTRDDLIALGLPPESADELVAFAKLLVAKAAARQEAK